MRALHRLTARTVAVLKKPGRHADGGNLYLIVSRQGHKSWGFMYALNGRTREMGLGPLHSLSLAEARDKAGAARKLLLDGIDPMDHRDAGRDAARLAAVKRMTFTDCANAYIESHRAGWKNAKHAAQWENTISSYCAPVFGALSVASIDVGLILKAIEPIWRTKTETAYRLLNRIEAVLDWATVRGYRNGDNPARWAGNIEHLLPARSDVAKVKHHAALPYVEIHDFIQSLRALHESSALALEFTILTAARTSETVSAIWSEFDLSAGVWTIPPERMKAKREHRVPLSSRAVELLCEMEKRRESDYVFPGRKEGSPLSNMAMLVLLQKRIGRPDLTVHGFRSTFRDWASERTAHPHDVIEAALAHVITDSTVAAYKRTDLLEKRRALLGEWAQFVDVKPVKNGNVVAFGRTGTA